MPTRRFTPAAWHVNAKAFGIHSATTLTPNVRDLAQALAHQIVTIATPLARVYLTAPRKILYSSRSSVDWDQTRNHLSTTASPS